MQNSKESQTILLKNGLKLGYAEYGDPKGKPLFFFHGWPSSRLQGRVLDIAAKKLKKRIIAPDRPGYGLSDFDPKRTLLDWPATITELANNLKIDTFSVLGNSGGGPYAAACAFALGKRLKKTGISVGLAPTNLDGVLEGLTFFNKLAWKGYHLFPFTIQIASLLHLAQVRKWLPTSFQAFFPAKVDQRHLSKGTKSEINVIRTEAFRQGKKAVALDLRLYTQDWGFDLTKISGTVLLWYGAKDKNVSVQMGEYYKSLIPNGKLKIFPNEGHLLLHEHAEEVLEALF
jgi:pimeloyl-ACP methyl ester carboxylesterase